MRRFVGFGSVLLLVAFSAVIGSSATASAAMRRVPLSDFAVQPTSVNFGNTPDNTTASIPVVVTIDAGYEFSDPKMSVEWGEISAPSGGCDGFVGPGNCIEDLTFSPTGTGDQTNVFEIDEVPTGGGSGEESLYVNESGDGVTCPTTDTSDMLNAYTTDGTFNGVFCLNTSGVGTYTQDAFDGAPSVSGTGEVVFTGLTTASTGGAVPAVDAPATPVGTPGGESLTIFASGPDLLLAGYSTGGGGLAVGNLYAKPIQKPPIAGEVPHPSYFEENAPLNTAGSFTMGLALCDLCVPGVPG
jgi:hypothetical protein